MLNEVCSVCSAESNCKISENRLDLLSTKSVLYVAIVNKLM